MRRNREGPLPAAISEALIALFNAGDWPGLEIAAEKATKRTPNDLLGWRALSKAHLHSGKMPEAIDVLSRLIERAPREADAHSDLGFALLAEGRTADAEKHCREAAMLNPDLAEAHANLGIILQRRGRFDEAVAAHHRAAKINPWSAVAHNNLGGAQRDNGQLAEAEASFHHALTLDPNFAGARINLGVLCFARRRFPDSIAHYRQALAIDPNSAAAHTYLSAALIQTGQSHEAEAAIRRALELRPDATEALVALGSILEALNRLEDAKTSYQRAIQLNPNTENAFRALGGLLSRLGGADAEATLFLRTALTLKPDDADAYTALGNIMMRQKQTAEALDMFRRAQTLRPLVTWPANQEHATFSALFLDTPMAGSTPVAYLAGRAAYDRHFHGVIPDTPEDIGLLRGKADVVFNMICNADDGAEILPHALELTERIGRPTINHPRVIRHTDRESIARRLAGIPHCVVPRTLRVAGTTLLAAARREAFAAMRPPLLVRLAGTHGGDDFEKCDDWPGVADFASRHAEVNLYLIEYHDYRSTDGYFRKYRIIFIDGQILPYHLAIHDDWKVHHFRTDMENQAWMRQEEARFLSDMGQTFSTTLQDSLRAIAAATGLDYGGIDCGIDRDGRLVVFEANAAMLVHDEPGAIYAYKNPAIARIKDAFDAMLARRRVPT
jgi:tetratricopeptide (TPR) repeat protein